MTKPKCSDKNCKINEKRTQNYCKCGLKMRYKCMCCDKWLSHSTTIKHGKRDLMLKMKGVQETFKQILTMVSKEKKNE